METGSVRLSKSHNLTNYSVLARELFEDELWNDIDNIACYRKWNVVVFLLYNEHINVSVYCWYIQ